MTTHEHEYVIRRAADREPARRRVPASIAVLALAAGLGVGFGGGSLAANAGDESPPPGSCEDEVKRQTVAMRRQAQGVNESLARNLLLAHGSLDLPPELMDETTGEAVPRSEWSEEQFEAWQEYLGSGEGVHVRVAIVRAGEEIYLRFDECGNWVQDPLTELD